MVSKIIVVVQFVSREIVLSDRSKNQTGKCDTTFTLNIIAAQGTVVRAIQRNNEGAIFHYPAEHATVNHYLHNITNITLAGRRRLENPWNTEVSRPFITRILIKFDEDTDNSISVVSDSLA